MSMNFATDVIINNSYSIQAKIIKALTAASSSSFGTGSNGQVLKSNGTAAYWGDSANVNVNTSTYWSTNSTYVPAAGEIIVYSDTETIKIGDGTTTVANLSSINSIEVVRL